MTILQYAALFNASSIFVVALISLVIRRRYSDAFFRNWTASYAGMVMLLAIETMTLWWGRGWLLTAPEILVDSVICWCYVRGALLLHGGDLPRWTLPAVLVVALGYMGAMAAAGQSGIAAFGPVVLLETASMVVLGAALLVRGVGQYQADRWLGVPLIGLALVVINYPWLAHSRWFWVGFWLSGVLQLLVGVGMLVMLLERGRESVLSYSQELEQLSSTLASQKERLEVDFAARTVELHQQKRFIELVLESVDEGIVGTDADHAIVFANPAASQLLGVAGHELVGQPFHDLAHHARADGTPCPADECPIVRAAENGENVVVRDDVLWRGDGQPLPVDYKVAPMRGAQAFTGAVISISDMTVRREREQLQASRIQMMARAEALKDEFLGSVSHELRTPLATIGAALQLLGRLPGAQQDASVRDYLQRIARANVTLTALVDDLLDASQLEAGRFSLDFAPIHPAEVALAVVEEFRPQTDKGRVNLALDLAAELPSLAGDAQRLAQVWRNLLGNAIRFTPPGGALRITLVQADGGVRAEVADSGPGIAAEDLARLFQRFGRLGGGAGPSTGTGLGLYIAKAIVDGHGGRIGVESTPGQGASFWFWLPSGPGASQAPC